MKTLKQQLQEECCEQCLRHLPEIIRATEKWLTQKQQDLNNEYTNLPNEEEQADNSAQERLLDELLEELDR